MTVLKWLLLWLLLFVTIGTIGRQPWMKYYRLSRQGAEVQGIAGSRKPNLQVAYSFVVNGHPYEGTGRAKPSGREISTGDEVLVHYLPENPKVSCLGDPRKLFETELPTLAISDFLFSTILVGLVAIGMKKKTASMETTRAL